MGIFGSFNMIKKNINISTDNILIINNIYILALIPGKGANQRIAPL